MKHIIVCLMGLLAWWCCVAGAWGGEATLDQDFQAEGRLTIDLGAYSDTANVVVVQPDGKILLGGASANGTNLDMALVRLQPDGSRDESFNLDGSVITPVGPGDDAILALGLLADGRIVAAGYTDSGTDHDFVVARYLPDGSLDHEFGLDGMVITSVGNGDDEITGLYIDKDNGVLVAGTVTGTAGRVVALARYREDGSLDTDFGDQGISMVGVGQDGLAQGVARRQDGSIVVSGSWGDGKRTAVMVLGFDPRGELRPAYGVEGIGVPVATSQISEGYGMTALPDGSVVVAGSVGVEGERDAALFRFGPDGQPDETFGDEGVLVTRASATDDVLYAVVGKEQSLTATGYAATENGRDLLVVACEFQGQSQGKKQATAKVANGLIHIGKLEVRQSRSPESIEYGQNRYPGMYTKMVTTDFGYGEAVGYGLALQPDGKVVVAGVTTEKGSPSMAVARFGSSKEGTVTKNTSASSLGPDISGYILTKEITDVTRVGAYVHCEVLPGAGRVVERGVVFSIAPNPSMKEGLPDGGGGDGNNDNNGDNGNNGDNSGDNSKPVTPKQIKGTAFMVPARIFSGDTMLRLTSKVADFLVTPAMAAGDGGSEQQPSDFLSQRESFLEEGYAKAGEGTGVYTAWLDNLKPGTFFYVRAYVKVEQGDGGEQVTYYGNQLGFRTADSCFVATAAFGSIFHPYVRVLRDFRDRFLMGHVVGERLVSLYYRYSPPIADHIQSNGGLRFLTRIMLLPLVGMAWIGLQTGGTGILLVAGALFCAYLFIRKPLAVRRPAR